MKKLILFICLGLIVKAGYSQTSVVDFLKGGKADAGKLSQAYLQPYAFALGDGLNNGWYNSAETHKLFGFDLSVSLSGIQIPDKDKTFDISALGLTNMTVANGGNIAPTIAGSKDPGPQLNVNDPQGNKLVSFNTPGGTALNIVPVPMFQLGFGLLPHTDVIGRYVPDTNFGNNGEKMNIGFWGLGVKHNFMEWIPVLKDLPFDASIFGSYSEANAQSALVSNASGFGSENVYLSFLNDNNQMLKMKSKTTKYGLIVSKKLGVLTFFGGIGHSTSESSVDLIGTYTINTKVQIQGTDYVAKTDLVDPIALLFKTNNVSMDAGLRLKIMFLSLFASINKAEYTSYNAGVSLGVR